MKNIPQKLQKFILIPLLIVILLLSVLQLYSHTNHDNFVIYENNESIIIELANNKYLEINSINDIVDDRFSYTARPFEDTSRRSFSSEGIDFTFLTKSHKEDVFFEDNSRTTTISQKNGNEIDIQIVAKTDYDYRENLFYYTQIDYSGETEFKEDKNSYYFKDKTCKVTYRKRPEFEFVDFGNNKTIRLKQDYSKTAIFNIKIEVDCQ